MNAIKKCTYFRSIGVRVLQNIRNKSTVVIDPPDDAQIQIPPYVEKVGEPLEQRKARLLYQSRKRGMLENGLLLSTFAAKYLQEMNADQVQQYDQLINQPSNDWEIFYWATGVKPVPAEFDNDIMKMFIEHVRNNNREKRISQPDLY
ncbi:PREDICTED: succinate dehydrogenase assembly factor 2, mitochondrial-like [Nicrophorus vespilloides]|uniref:Succinate dehydrogenase assembly factor 2, mitochondrial n=1 Tax=Nicrophorus vespilloides TaxID=110193 RepID=A0ABM1MUZ2_NICVS|nr:PREDICTED: succinate dehydrogenase assembly factor 2, mitochondrial-like [Nicrophorus vespilloides]